MARKKYCPACGTRMDYERTTHRAINAEGRPVQYYNVLRYVCPQGCATATFDFSQASLDPDGRDRGFRLHVETSPEGEAVVTETFLDRFDFSYFLTVVGLILGYLLFTWALFTIPAPPVGKILFAALLTLSAFYVIIHLTTKAERTAVLPARAVEGSE